LTKLPGDKVKLVTIPEEWLLAAPPGFVTLVDVKSLRVQVMVAAEPVVSSISVAVLPEQMVCVDVDAEAAVVGSTVTVVLKELPLQVTPFFSYIKVYVKETSTGTFVALVNEPVCVTSVLLFTEM
jgi:hypothetical protein